MRDNSRANMNRKIILTTLLLHFSSASSRETIVSIDDKDKTQYHEVNYDARSYNFGYEVGTNRQFHHEVRGSDGVTYGCFGYFDPDDKLLMTHYVADAHGYRLIESNKPVKIYPVVADPKSSSLDKSENSIEPKMILTEWKDLFLPKGCRMIENGHFNNNNNINNRNNIEGSNDLRNIPLPGIGITHTHNDPQNSQTTHGAGIGGQFTGAFGNTGSFNLGHGHVPTQDTNTQSNSQPDFPSEGSSDEEQSTQGGYGEHGGTGGYGNNGGQGGYGPNGPHGHGSEYHPGGYRPDPNNPDANPNSNCNHPSHKPHTTTQYPYTSSSTTQSTTRKTTKSTTTTRRPETRPTTYSQTVTTYRPTPTRPNTYPTRPSSTPNPTGSQGGNLGVQPPSTSSPQFTQNPGLIYPGSHPPLFFVPFPFPIAPTCPCYYMHSHNGNFSSQFPYGNVNAQWQSQNNHQQPQYAIGLIPILFVPHCMPPSSNYSNDIPGQYMQVPYPCAQCNYLQNHRDGRELFNENSNEVFSSSDSFKQVLAQAGVNSLDTFFVRSPPRRMRMKKLKRVQNIQEPKENETQEITTT